MQKKTHRFSPHNRELGEPIVAAKNQFFLIFNNFKNMLRLVPVFFTAIPFFRILKAFELSNQIGSS